MSNLESYPVTSQPDQEELSQETFSPELRSLWQRVAEESSRYGGNSEPAQPASESSQRKG